MIIISVIGIIAVVIIHVSYKYNAKLAARKTSPPPVALGEKDLSPYQSQRGDVIWAPPIWPEALVGTVNSVPVEIADPLDDNERAELYGRSLQNSQHPAGKNFIPVQPTLNGSEHYILNTQETSPSTSSQPSSSVIQIITTLAANLDSLQDIPSPKSFSSSTTLHDNDMGWPSSSATNDGHQKDV